MNTILAAVLGGCLVCSVACAGSAERPRETESAPGARLAADGRIVAVGLGRIPEGLRADRARRFAVQRAERDAKRRMAAFAFPDDFGPGRTTLFEVKGARVESVREVAEPWQAMEVTMSADRNGIVVKRLSAIAGLATASDVWLRGEAYDPLKRNPQMVDGGGALFSTDGGWIALGVGLATLDAGARNAETVARIEAGRALAEAVFGARLESVETDRENEFLDAAGKAGFRQWMQRETRETVEGTLRRAEVVGRWRTDDDHLAIVLAVAVPALSPPDTEEADDSAAEAANAAGPAPEKPPGWTVAPKWEAFLLSRPAILSGGAASARADGQHALVAVGAATLKGNAQYDRIAAPTVAESDARRRLVAYLSGSALRGVRVDREEYEKRSDGGDGAAVEAYRESMDKSIAEKVAGSMAGMEKIGEWKSPDGRTLYIAYAVRVDR